MSYNDVNLKDEFKYSFSHTRKCEVGQMIGQYDPWFEVEDLPELLDGFYWSQIPWAVEVVGSGVLVGVGGCVGLGVGVSVGLGTGVLVGGSGTEVSVGDTRVLVGGRVGVSVRGVSSFAISGVDVRCLTPNS